MSNLEIIGFAICILGILISLWGGLFFRKKTKALGLRQNLSVTLLIVDSGVYAPSLKETLREVEKAMIESKRVIENRKPTERRRRFDKPRNESRQNIDRDFLFERSGKFDETSKYEFCV